LDMLDDPSAALELAAVSGVTLVATVADVTEAPLGTFDALPVWIEEAEKRMSDWGVAHAAAPEVRIIVGVHPHNAKGYTGEVALQLERLAGDPRVAAIGETGLDFHYDHSPRDWQFHAFRAQLEMAHRLRLPVAVHLREAHEEGLEILREMGVPEAGCIIHCFTEGPKTAELFLEMGCHISFGGTVTFKKADTVRKAAAVVPLDRLLLETDCPFMTPEPYRGVSNQPAWVTFTAERLAEIKGIPTAELATATMQNSTALLGRPRE
ncbi:MAG TPA: TatD family hydrolase, partial [Coriobacteriia bacterium]